MFNYKSIDINYLKRNLNINIMNTNKKYSNIKDNLIFYIDENKPDTSILHLIKTNMLKQKLILTDLDEYYTNFLINFCDKYNLKYELIGFNKKLLIIKNNSHKYLTNETQIPTISSKSKVGYTFLNKHNQKNNTEYNKEDITKQNTNQKDIYKNYTYKENIIEELINKENTNEENTHEENTHEESTDEENTDEENTDEENTDEENTDEENTDEENTDEIDNDIINKDNISSCSYTTQTNIKKILIDYNNIFTKGEHVIYLLSNMNLIFNMIIIYKLFMSDFYN